MRRLALLWCLLFAAAAALGVVPWLDAMGSVWGEEQALSRYLLLLAVAHPLVVTPSLKQGLLAVAIASALAAPAAIWTPDCKAAAFVAALLVSVPRAIVLLPAGALVSVGRELAIAAGALGAAALMFDSSELGTVLAVWSFWLVQAAGTLFAPAAQQHEPAATDPFEQAYAAAMQSLQTPERTN